jgi:cytochrome c553
LRYAGAFLLATALLITAACQQATRHAAAQPTSPALPALSASAALASSCSGCHAATHAAVPDFGGRDSATLSARLTTYKYDSDGTTVMHRLARGFSDEQIAMISDYLAMETADD